MRHERSAPEEPSAVQGATLPWPAAIAVTLLGVAAMSASPLLGLHRGGLRTQVAVGTLLLALPALAALAARPAFLRGAVGTWPVASRVLGLAGALGLALWVASVGLMEIQSLVVPPTPEYLELFRRLHHALAPTGPFDAIVSLVVIAVLPGLCEELLVRGALLPSLVDAELPAFLFHGSRRSRRLGRPAAIVASALLFAAMHFDLVRFLFTFSIGLVLGIVRLRTGSLWPAVVAHVTLNGLTFLIAPLVDDPSKAYTPEPALGFGALAVGVALSWPLLQRLRPAAPQTA